MIGTYAKRLWAPDYPWAPTREAREHFFEDIRTNWGKPVGIEVRAPSRASDPAFRAWWSNYLRQGASPGAALALTQMNAEIDVRDVLPLVRVPTLVLHRTGDQCLLVDEGRYVADLIPGSRFVALPRQRPSAVRRRSGHDDRRDSILRHGRDRCGTAGPRAGDRPQRTARVEAPPLRSQTTAFSITSNARSPRFEDAG